MKRSLTYIWPKVRPQNSIKFTYCRRNDSVTWLQERFQNILPESYMTIFLNSLILLIRYRKNEAWYSSIIILNINSCLPAYCEEKSCSLNPFKFTLYFRTIILTSDYVLNAAFLTQYHSQQAKLEIILLRISCQKNFDTSDIILSTYTMLTAQV